MSQDYSVQKVEEVMGYRDLLHNLFEKKVSATYRLRQLLAAVLCVLTGFGGFIGCAETNITSPRKVVIELFGAMERNDKPVLASLLDLQALMEARQLDYALNLDTARVFSSPKQIFEDLTEDGLTKRTWFNFQRVVGDEEVVGDTAFVEVSFVDQESGTQTFNKFGVHKIGERWRIFSFRTLVAPQ